MNGKQKESLIIALAEKGATYRENHKEGRSISKHDKGGLE